MGRFMSPDRPVDQHTEDPQSMNLYTYVRNNPLNSTDPSGNFDCDMKDKACGQAILANFKIREAASDISNPNMFAMQKVSDALGTYGDHNGVTINSADLGAPDSHGLYTGAQATMDGKTITFNNNSKVPQMDTDQFAVTMVHEGTHIMQDNQRAASPIQYSGFLEKLWGSLTGSSGGRSYNDNFRLESEAYQNQGYMEQYLHRPGQIYDPTLKGDAQIKNQQQQVRKWAGIDARCETSGCQ